MILLDTHALLWLALDPAQLSKKAAAEIRKASVDGSLVISAITCWEVARLCARKRLAFTGTVSSFVEKLTGLTTILPLTPAIAAVGAELPEEYPKDPADRIIGATALVHGIPLITKDVPIRRSRAIKTVW